MNKTLYLSLGLYLYTAFFPITTYSQSNDHYCNTIFTLREVRKGFLREIDVLRKRGEEPKLHIDYINDLEKRLRKLESEHNCNIRSSK